MTSQFVDMTSSSKFFDVVLFLLSSLVTDFFLRNSLEIWKLEKLPPEFCPISGDWGKLGIQKYPE